MDRRQRIFLYGVILGLAVFFFIFHFMNAAFRATHGVEVHTPGSQSRR